MGAHCRHEQGKGEGCYSKANGECKGVIEIKEAHDWLLNDEFRVVSDACLIGERKTGPREISGDKSATTTGLQARKGAERVG
jgi:hypothetical protein